MLLALAWVKPDFHDIVKSALGSFDDYTIACDLRGLRVE
jgi:hypothetical protein